MTPRNEREKRQRALLWRRQKGRCFWCKEQMSAGWGRPGPLPRKLATIDHLDHRMSPERGQNAGMLRKVLACRECNERRGREDQRRYEGA